MIFYRNPQRARDIGTGYGLKVYAAPAVEPITTDEAKLHLRVDTPDENAYIDTLVKAARYHVENWIGRRLITQTWDLARDDFPVGNREMNIPYGPVASISSITYTDSGGSATVLSSANYILDTYSLLARVYPDYSLIWPNTRAQRNAVIVRYVTGYGASGASVPSNIIHAMKLLIAHWYENREEVFAERSVTPLQIPQAAEALLSPERESWL